MRALVAFLVAMVVALLCLPAAAADDTQLETPRKALELFIEASSRGDYLRASDALDLRQVRADQRKTKGPELASQLSVVLVRVIWVDLDAIPDEQKPKPDEKVHRITVVPLRGREVPITLANTSTTPVPRWTVSAGTVAVVPQLYEQFGPGPIESHLPPSIRDPRVGWLYVWQWVGIGIAVPFGFGFGRLVAGLLGFFARRLATRTRAKWDDELVERLTGPTRLFLALVMFRALLEPLALTAAALYTSETCLKVAFIGTLGFAAVRVVSVVSKTIEERAVQTSTSTTGVMRARGVTTQVRVLRRVINMTLGVLAVALMLTQFETVRNVGVSLLASAGLVGVVFGFAAQRTIGSLIAGIQLSATQPVRIGERFRLGSAVLEISQPRMPCATIERQFERKGMVAAILNSGRCGWYFRVIEDGEAAAGDALEPVAGTGTPHTVRATFMALANPAGPVQTELVHQLAECPALTSDWRAKASSKLRRHTL